MLHEQVRIDLIRTCSFLMSTAESILESAAADTVVDACFVA